MDNTSDLSYHRKYYIKNKSKILEKQKTKRLDPSFKIKMTTYYKNYYLKNKDRILENKCLNPKQNIRKKEVIQAQFIRKTTVIKFD